MSVRVLIVDDERDAVETWTRLLESSNVVCLKAYSGTEAITLIETEHPDLVVTDYNLPGTDGLEVARHARMTFPPTPVIMVTAYHSVLTERAARNEGIGKYLLKPVTNEELLSSVKCALESDGFRRPRD